MVFDPMAIHGVFDEIGFDVVDDDFANGWRTAAKPELRVDDLAAGVAEYLFSPAPECCIHNPDLDRHAYLVDKARRAGADGVVFWYIKFCEPDAFDRPQLVNRLKDEGFPATTIEVELAMSNFDAVRTRINAFREMLDTT